MDEREALDRLRAAVPDELPPATFDHGSVVRASRAAQRRRRQVVTGALATVLVVGGLGGAVAALRELPGGSSSDAAATAGTVAASGRAGGLIDPAPSGVVPGGQAPDNGLVGCATASQALVRAVVQALPAVSGRGPYPLTRACPAGTTGSEFRVGDGPTSERLQVLLGPAPVASAGPSGSARTADGRLVTVIALPTPDGSPGPYAARLGELAAKVAAALG